MVELTPELMYIASVVDDKVEKYFGEYLKSSYDLKDPIKYGKGLLINRYNELYEGWFDNDELSGYGRLIKPYGFYIGQFHKSHFNGFGKFFYNSGTIYEGEFKESRYEGWGNQSEPDGSKYVGDFNDSRRQGVGVQKYADGSSYEGLWLDDYRHYKGTFVQVINK